MSIFNINAQSDVLVSASLCSIIIHHHYYQYIYFELGHLSLNKGYDMLDIGTSLVFVAGCWCVLIPHPRSTSSPVFVPLCGVHPGLVPLGAGGPHAAPEDGAISWTEVVGVDAARASCSGNQGEW
jgi:hypothetical protein